MPPPRLPDPQAGGARQMRTRLSRDAVAKVNSGAAAAGPVALASGGAVLRGSGHQRMQVMVRSWASIFSTSSPARGEGCRVQGLLVWGERGAQCAWLWRSWCASTSPKQVACGTSRSPLYRAQSDWGVAARAHSPPFSLTVDGAEQVHYSLVRGGEQPRGRGAKGQVLVGTPLGQLHRHLGGQWQAVAGSSRQQQAVAGGRAGKVGGRAGARARGEGEGVWGREKCREGF